MPDSDLFSAVRHVHAALATASPSTEVDLPMVEALLRGRFAAGYGEQVLAVLVISGTLDQPARGRFVTRPPAPDLLTPTGFDDLLLLIEGLLQQAARADRTLRPHTWRLNPVTDPQLLPSRDAAVRWFDDHRSALLAALDMTIEQVSELDLAVALSDALDGLLQWTGHRHDRARVAELAAVALIRQQLGPYLAGQEPARTRRHLVRMALVYARICHARTDLEEHTDALRAAATAAEFAHRSDEPAAVAAALAARGRALAAQGPPADAVPDLRHAVDVDQAHGDDHGTALYRHLLGRALAGSGHHRDALVELRLAGVALVEIGDRVAGARVLTTMGAVHRRDGDTRVAFVVLGQALLVLAEHGAHADLGDVYAELARSERDTGDLDTARAYYRAAAQHYRLDGHAVWTDTEATTTT